VFRFSGGVLTFMPWYFISHRPLQPLLGDTLRESSPPIRDHRNEYDTSNAHGRRKQNGR
jgi:hypothetical protein